MNWGEALEKAQDLLRAAGIDSWKLDARLLLAHLEKQDVSVISAFPERIISDQRAYDAMIIERSNFKPVSHILGYRDFWNLQFRVNENVLDPRPDSETLIEAVLDHFPDKAQALRIIDFGTGSGCLLLTLLSEYPNATGLGVDISSKALEIAEENAAILSLSKRAEFIKSDWDEFVSGKFDIVISNPPYITSDDMRHLSKDVFNFEPHLALHGGEDGLSPYRHLIPAAKNLLTPHGLLVFEFGYQQSESIEEMLNAAKFENIKAYPDLSGIIRCLVARPPKT
ncbi:MAG: peptide chain release factor N(5)-glutamine methyltransferase [Alphaproteobacteria bacterium]|nr:peptide chain release factor N(5)-glutamine methyltransferase [Alphaproteobacteria bacterium]